MKTKCSYCGYIATEYETIDGEKNPVDEDIGFCIECGEFSQFKNDKRVKLDLNSLNESTKQEINRIRVAWLRTRQLLQHQKYKK